MQLIEKNYSVEGLSFPSVNPPGFECDSSDEVAFDEDIHLSISAPEWIKPLITDSPEKQWHYPIDNSKIDNFPGLAFTAPFRILSPEGVKEVKRIILKNSGYLKADERRPHSMRGLGYRSKFIRDLAYSPRLLAHLSKMVGKPIWPQNSHMNISQINVGKAGCAKAPEMWHLDSVPYVIVLILSDMEGMVGGELQVARLKDPHEALRKIHGKCLDDKDITTVGYAAAGHGIFMQGSRIAHTVTPVIEAREDRIALINSYQTLCPFDYQHYNYRTFKYLDPEYVLPVETARSAAWQAMGQLSALTHCPPVWGEEGRKKSLFVLEEAIKTLNWMRSRITGEVEEEAPFVPDMDGFKVMKAKQNEGFKSRVVSSSSQVSEVSQVSSGSESEDAQQLKRRKT